MISKEQVEKQALSLFSAYGLKSVHMDDLAKELSVSKKTLYQLYNSKEELVLSLFENLRESWEAGIHQILNSSGNPIKKLLQLIRFRYQFIGRMNPTFLLRSSQQYEKVYAFTTAIIDKMEGVLIRLLVEARENGYLLSDVNVTTFRNAHELTVTAYLEQFNPLVHGSDEIFKLMIISQLAGICNIDKVNVWTEYRELPTLSNAPLL